MMLWGDMVYDHIIDVFIGFKVMQSVRHFGLFIKYCTSPLKHPIKLWYLLSQVPVKLLPLHSHLLY